MKTVRDCRFCNIAGHAVYKGVKMDNNIYSDIVNLEPWDAMMKMMAWNQLGEIKNKRILDFGSGIGVTASHYAAENEVVAIEPSEESVSKRWLKNDYRQICGSTEILEIFEDESFDVIICHNVLEYAKERKTIIKEFSRLLKKDGYISIIKHNKPGRIMQMIVLLNDFDRANSLLDGNDCTSAKYGDIHYYDDADVEKWGENLKVAKTMGMRTFWDLQQNQDVQRDVNWQNNMLKMEMRVQDIEEYKYIAFFHHLIIKKAGK